MSNPTSKHISTWPTRLSLTAVALSWDIHYESLEDEGVSLKEEERKLIVSGALKQLADCKPSVSAWLKGQAALYLEPWVKKLSKHCELPYKNLEFRGQKTLWGSCSEGDNISLNYKLLFLPARLVRYVLIHELCHLKHFDHSKEFWRLVERFEPNCRRLKQELKQANQYIPEWLLK